MTNKFIMGIIRSYRLDPDPKFTEWVITLNNPTYYEIIKCFDIVTRESIVTSNQSALYSDFIFGFENQFSDYSDGYDDETLRNVSTMHLQICFRLKQAVTFKKLKYDWPRAHIEVVNTHFDNAYQYCKKEGTYFELSSIDDGLLNGIHHVDPNS